MDVEMQPDGCFSTVEGAMARRRDVLNAPRAAEPPEMGLGDRVRRALEQRIGADRYAVWFGESAQIAVQAAAADAEPVVTLAIGRGFAHEWLRKTFREDVEVVARAACGPRARVEWQEAVDAADSIKIEKEAVSASPRSTPRPARRSKAENAPREQGVQKAMQRAAVQPPQQGNRAAASFETFIVGASNRMAYAAVELASNRPGEMSPLFLHGPSGVGKSHLLEAFCGQARERHPGATVVFLSAEQFTTAFLQALHGSGLPGFRRSCRQADLLVVDDVQFFIGKRATIVEFQQTIDALLRSGRQMVFAADRDLDSLGDLGPDLLARLKGGMQARVLPPDTQVRRGIVAGLAARRGLDVPAQVVDYVAAHITRHARELVGAINRLEASSHMLGMPITPGMAEEALADLVRSSGRGVKLADIERAVCTAFGIDRGSLQSSRRSRSVSQPRMLAMFLARKHTSSALAEIGSYFGRRSHSTVITAQKTVEEWLSGQESIVLADASWDAREAVRRVEDLLRVG